MAFYRNCVQSEERNSSFHREMFNSKSKIPIVVLDVSHPSLIQAKSTITLLLGGKLTLQAEVGQMQKDLGLLYLSLSASLVFHIHIPVSQFIC